MQIYIGNLPPGTVSSDLRAVLYKEINRSILRRLGLSFAPRIDFSRDVKFRMVQKKRDDQVIRYGIAEFTTREAAKFGITLLHRVKLRGQRMVVHEYMHRTYSNDLRAIGSSNKRRQEPERRRSDRRSTRDYFWEAQSTTKLRLVPQ